MIARTILSDNPNPRAGGTPAGAAHRLTPPDCGKRVWFLDLGHPAFGMSPLRGTEKRETDNYSDRGIVSFKHIVGKKLRPVVEFRQHRVLARKIN